MIIGGKNAGKSYLTDYMYNKNKQKYCILDTDLGKGKIYPGCILLMT